MKNFQFVVGSMLEVGPFILKCEHSINTISVIDKKYPNNWQCSEWVQGIENKTFEQIVLGLANGECTHGYTITTDGHAYRTQNAKYEETKKLIDFLAKHLQILHYEPLSNIEKWTKGFDLLIATYLSTENKEEFIKKILTDETLINIEDKAAMLIKCSERTCTNLTVSIRISRGLQKCKILK